MDVSANSCIITHKTRYYASKLTLTNNILKNLCFKFIYTKLIDLCFFNSKINYIIYYIIDYFIYQ